MSVVTPGREYGALDITTRGFWSQPFAIRDQTFAQLRNLFRELLTRLHRVEFGEPSYLQSSFVHGIKHLPAFVQ